MRKAQCSDETKLMLISKTCSDEVQINPIHCIRTCHHKDYKLRAKYVLNDFIAETFNWKINQSGAAKQQVYLD